MATIAVPARLAFNSVEALKLQRQSNTLRSYFTGKRQTIVYPFAVWFLNGKIVDSSGADAADIRSFLVQLEGQKNNFRLPIPGYTQPSTGYLANRNTTVAAAARATSLTVGGGGAGLPYLGNGDYFMIQDELKMATAPIAFNGGGTAVISFLPGLRKTVAIGVPVIVANPTILMHATADDIAKWALSKPVIHGFDFEAVEDI